ncbi:MAG: hypothetical protein NTX50_20840 [Candidatus Sumerlaeota bacterium]|nr:hypothetical protein [Candidatus Sumerlaeota bacterium]
MARYRNEYSKDEDFMMWQLHKIRRQIAALHQTPEQINEAGRQVIAKYGLTNLKLAQPAKIKSKAKQVRGHATAER